MRPIARSRRCSGLWLAAPFLLSCGATPSRPDHCEGPCVRQDADVATDAGDEAPDGNRETGFDLLDAIDDAPAGALDTMIDVVDSPGDRSPDSVADAPAAAPDVPNSAADAPDGEADAPQAAVDAADAGGDLPRDGDTGGAGTCAPTPAQQVWKVDVYAGPIYAVAALAADDVWRMDGAKIWHSDGVTWSPMLGASPGFDSWSLLPLDRDDVWVIGGAGVQHWDGVAWQDRSPPVIPDRLAATRSHEVWALVGVYQNDPPMVSVLQWNGSDWVDRTPSPPASGDAVLSVNAVWGATPNDVWGVGYAQLPSRVRNGILLHWDGATWTEAGDFHAAARVSLEFDSLWGSSANDIWTLGINPTEAELWHYDGTGWQKNRAIPYNYNYDRNQLRGPCAGTVWAMAGTAVWHYDGVAWSSRQFSDRVFDVSAWGTDALVAVAGPDTNQGRLFRTLPDGMAGCGNGRIDPGEECDPPVGPPCFSDCSRAAICGDGVLERGEQCDPPDRLTCDSYCQYIPICGNGRVDIREDCDPPDGVTCNSRCHVILCGNGDLDPGEDCDPPHQGPPFPQCDQSCHIMVCGNLKLDPGEQCDPPRFGTLQPAPWCDQSCQIPRCGNGIIDPGEACDPPEQGWTPGHPGGLYCGADCDTENACAECHQRCDSDPRGYPACERATCCLGRQSPCGNSC